MNVPWILGLEKRRRVDYRFLRKGCNNFVYFRLIFVLILVVFFLLNLVIFALLLRRTLLVIIEIDDIFIIDIEWFKVWLYFHLFYLLLSCLTSKYAFIQNFAIAVDRAIVPTAPKSLVDFNDLLEIEVLNDDYFLLSLVVPNEKLVLCRCYQDVRLYHLY